MNESVHFICIEKGGSGQTLRKLELWKEVPRGVRTGGGGRPGGDANTEIGFGSDTGCSSSDSLFPLMPIDK